MIRLRAISIVSSWFLLVHPEQTDRLMCASIAFSRLAVKEGWSNASLNRNGTVRVAYAVPSSAPLHTHKPLQS